MNGTHSDFRIGFILAAIAVGLSAGFGFASILSLYAGLEWSVGQWWVPLLQAHGHCQLVGWIGLFVIGVSLYFVPHLTGSPLRSPVFLKWVLVLLLTGILSRSVFQALTEDVGTLPSTALAASGLLEAAGMDQFISWVLIPVPLAFSIRTFPL